MNLEVVRVSLEAIASFTDDARIRALAEKALDNLEDADERARRKARERQQRHRRERAGPAPPVTDNVTLPLPDLSRDVTLGHAATVTDPSAPRARDLDLDLSGDSGSLQDFPGDLHQGGPGGEEPQTDVTRNGHVTPVTGHLSRKKPTTHCPGPEESADRIDAWCRGQRIPPASQVPDVMAMIRWHQKNGKPRASWLATWQDWQRSPYQSGPARVGSATQPGLGPAIDLREENRRADDVVARREAAARAREADEEQAKHARFAHGRPPTTPARLGSAPLPKEKTR